VAVAESAAAAVAAALENKPKGSKPETKAEPTFEEIMNLVLEIDKEEEEEEEDEQDGVDSSDEENSGEIKVVAGRTVAPVDTGASANNKNAFFSDLQVSLVAD
jgi:hypothetical protein